MFLPSFQEIHIENTNACGYKCVMCPRESQTRRIGYMSVEDFSLILERVHGFQGVFHLHGYGEPLLDRQFIAKIEKLKAKFPTCPSGIFSTLGVKVKEDYFERVVGAGLNCIAISLYGFTSDDYQKIHGFDGLELVKRNLISLSQAMKQSLNFSATIKVPSKQISSSLPVAESPEKIEFCQWAASLGFSINEWGYVHNYSDGRSYNLPSENKMCPVINGRRKNILNITWDLSVIPCCYDFNATIRWGNLRHNTLEEIFSSPQYLDFVIAHRTNDLSSYPICRNCEKHDY